jgi:hypothetical protein
MLYRSGWALLSRIAANHLAHFPFVQGVTGEYWSGCQVAKGSRYLNDTVMAQRLWNKSEEILESHVRGTA